MKTKIVYLLGVLFLSSGLAACQNGKKVQSCDETVLKTHLLVPFEIHLEACLSCGYDWFLEPVDTLGIRLISKTSKPLNATPGIVGGNAMVTWEFSGLQEGEYRLVFNYRRPWEKEVLKTRTYRVIVTPGEPGQEGSTRLTIVVPEDASAYREAMTRYAQEGGEDPLSKVNFMKKEIFVPATTEIMQAGARAAAEYVYPGQTSAGVPAVDSIAFFRVQHDTAYILLSMDVDGWAGVSVALAIVHPVVEKTLLQFPGIRYVVFGYPGTPVR